MLSPALRLNISGETWHDLLQVNKGCSNRFIDEGWHSYLKDKEDEDNNTSDDENVTEEGDGEHDLTDIADVEENCFSPEVLPALGGAALCCVALCW